MKKEELTALGMTEEQAAKVLELHSSELAAEKQKLTDKEAELTMATEKITELTETVKKFDGVDVDKLRSDLDAANKKYAEDTAALKLDNALALALEGSGAMDKDIVRRLIDKSIIKTDTDGKLVGLAEQLDKLKAEKSFLFSAEPAGARIVNTGLDHGSGTDSISDAQARAVMGLPVSTK